MSVAKSELCIFDRPSPQIVIEHAGFEDIYPVNAITADKNDVEFNIIGSKTEYLDLNDTLLHISLKVVFKEGVELTKEQYIQPANYMFHTLFDDVVLRLNNTKIEGGNNTYAHKALIETIINYSGDSKNTCLGAMGYHKDDAVRKTLYKKDKEMYLCSSLQLDFMDQPKYLIPGINVHIRHKRSESSFALEDSDKLKPKIILTNAKLMVRRVRVDPAVFAGHTIGLRKQNAVYPIRKKEVVAYALNINSSTFYKEQIFGDQRLPNFLLVTFQSSGQFNGSYAERSSSFKHFDVSNVSLYRNTDYKETYTQNFEENDYACSYMQSIVRNMGYLDKNLNCGISLNEFKSDYPFFTFVLSPDFDINQNQLPQQGNLRLDIKFAKPLPEACYVVIYGLFETEIQITANGRILL